MTPLRVLIVDDEPLARQGLRRLLRAETGLEVVGECADGAEAITCILADPPDLVLLDVQMPGIDGFGVVERVGAERMPVVVFVTAYDQYALRAFEAHALDYVLKPVDPARLRLALSRALAAARQRGAPGVEGQLRALVEDLTRTPRYLERVAVRTQGRIRLLPIAEIDWIEAEDDYVRLHAQRQSLLLHETLSGLEAKLDPSRFLRVHRSRIVNLDSVRELHPMFNGEYEIVLEGGARVGTGRTYRERLQGLVANLPETTGGRA